MGRLLPLLFLAAVFAFPLLACDGDEDDADETPAPTATARSPATSTSLPDIRDADFAGQRDIQALVSRAGGEVATADIVFVDLTGDGEEEAIVPISSGGTAGLLAFAVLGYRDGGLAALLTAVPGSGSIRFTVENSQVVALLPVYGEGDQPGFPGKIKRVHYRWDGEQFTVEREETVENPNAPPKP